MEQKILFIFLFCCLIYTPFASGKEREHVVQGKVIDNMTGSGLAGVTIILMSNDSTAIDTVAALPAEAGEFAGVYQLSIRKIGKYMVKAVCDGYEDGFTVIELRSNREGVINARPIRMVKCVHEIPEITVKATKVKMFMEGDTVVFNADAFNLADGSMLDALISRLPGATLTKGGQIFFNGQYVQNLLVNGKDFFSGNPKIALENLPAYTVNRIKVYNKSGALSKMMGKDMGDRSLVMDVRLKKEYSSTYLGNVEGGSGTNNRYIGRIFGMRMSEVEGLGIYGNVNNINNNKTAAEEDGWSPLEVQSGLLSTHSGGLSYAHSLGNSDSWFSSENVFSHTDGDDDTHIATQTYLPSGDSFKNSDNKQITKNTTWTSHNQMNIWNSGNFITNDLNVSLSNSSGHGNASQEISEVASPQNASIARNSDDGKLFNLSFSQKGGKKVIADFIRWGLSADYDYTRTKEFSLMDVRYFNSITPRDYRNNYLHNSNRHWNVGGNLSYAIGLNQRFIYLDYDYRYAYNKTSNMLYRLDKLYSGVTSTQGTWASDSTRFDILPSNLEALNSIIDTHNSYKYREYRNTHKFSLSFQGMFPGVRISESFLSIPLRLVYRNLHYQRSKYYKVSRQALFLEPLLSVKGTLSDLNWEFKASIVSDIPDLTTMVDYRDDTNPLSITYGNPDLKDIHKYNAMITMKKQWKRQQMLSMSLGYDRQDNAVAYGLSYDSSTGVSIVKPQNVNGNWDVNARLNFSASLDSMQKWTLDNHLITIYNHSVDLATVQKSQLQETASNTNLLTPNSPQRSIVNNWHVGDDFKINFRLNDKFGLTLHVAGNLYLINSKRDQFDDITAGDYNIGINTTTSLPLRFQLSTDMTLFARRGWQQNEMNTTDWVWNAQISRSFFKDRLLAKIQGFDILHQLSNTSYVINAQGRTETWHNSMQRYAMLSLVWKFNINPKKK